MSALALTQPFTQGTYFADSRRQDLLQHFST